MKKMIFASAMTILSTAAAFALPAKDLTLPGAKWIAQFDKFVCAAYGEAVAAPKALAQLNIRFENMVSDASLDNAIVTAEFDANGATCRYNAILLADNNEQTAELVQSIAYNKADTATAYLDCKAGKEIIDAGFKAKSKYLYYGHPHNLSLMLPGLGAESACGSDVVGANFVVTGTLK